MASVLVTGASGVIGRWVRRSWPASLELITLTRDETDLRDSTAFSAAIRRIRPDMLLHLAWSASAQPGYRDSIDNDDWVTSSLAAAHTCSELGVHFVGTGSVVDDRPGSSRYSRAKYQLRSALHDEIEAGIVTWLRPFYVLDPVHGRPALVAAINAARSKDQPVALATPWSRHDFILAPDVGTAIATVLEARVPGCVEIGSGSVRAVFQVAEAMGAPWCPARPEHQERGGESAADTLALRSHGWSPIHTERFFAHD